MELILILGAGLVLLATPVVYNIVCEIEDWFDAVLAFASGAILALIWPLALVAALLFALSMVPVFLVNKRRDQISRAEEEKRIRLSSQAARIKQLERELGI